METSAAGDPAHPGRLPGLPASSGDEDLGGHPSSASWAPSRPPVQLQRWRPRQLVIRRILHALQASRPAPAMKTSAAGDPAHPARLPGLPPSRSDGDLGSYPSSASCPPSRPSAQPVRRTPRQLSFQRVLPAFQVFLPAHPARLPGLPSSSGDGDLGSW